MRAEAARSCIAPPLSGVFYWAESSIVSEERRVGRPSDYDPAFADQAKKLCELGATDADVAEFFEVSERTVYRWAVRHEEFCQALKAGKGAADERVVRSLYHRAVGYTFDAVKIFLPKGATEPVYAPYREHVPPDTTAAIFWLKNRRKDDWRDKQDVQHSNDPENPMPAAVTIFQLPDNGR